MANINAVTILVPEKVNVGIVNNTITAKGEKGEIVRSFINPRISISSEDNKIIIKLRPDIKFSQKDKMFINTYKAHIKNIFLGVTQGYKAKLKICSGHFPMNITLESNNIVIKNFLGEKIPRKTSIIDGVKVNIQGDEILVNGIDKEKVGQTAARIEQLTRVTNRDRHVFQDGCYIIQKPGEEND